MPTVGGRKKPKTAPANPKCCARSKVRDENKQIVRDENGEYITRPCDNYAITGGTVCWSHGGRTRSIRAKAAIRAEVLLNWGLGDTTVDPAEMLLRLLTQSGARAARYAAELEALVEEHGGNLAAALVGDTLVVDKDGHTVKVGEYVRGLAKLEAEERDRCAGMAIKAIAAGLAERQVKLAEQQAQIVIKAVEAALDAAGVSGEQRSRGKIAAARQLRAVE